MVIYSVSTGVAGQSIHPSRLCPGVYSGLGHAEYTAF